MSVEAIIKTVTPEMAKKWLDSLNQINRKISHLIVDRYANEMVAGRWIITNEGIGFNGDGKLIDGQHRLAACVKSNLSFNTVIVTGLNKTAQTVVNTGKQRYFQDVLSMRGHKNVIVLATVIRYLYAYKKLSPMRENTIRTYQNYELLYSFYKTLNEDEISEAQNKMTCLYRKVNILSTTISTFAFIIFAEVSKHHASDFFKKLYLGTDLTENDAILSLRNTLIEMKSDKVYWNNMQKIKAIFTTWNCYRLKKPLGKWNFNHELAEPI